MQQAKTKNTTSKINLMLLRSRRPMQYLPIFCRANVVLLPQNLLLVCHTQCTTPVQFKNVAITNRLRLGSIIYLVYYKFIKWYNVNNLEILILKIGTQGIQMLKFTLTFSIFMFTFWSPKTFYLIAHEPALIQTFFYLSSTLELL